MGSYRQSNKMNSRILNSNKNQDNIDNNKQKYHSNNNKNFTKYDITDINFNKPESNKLLIHNQYQNDTTDKQRINSGNSYGGFSNNSNSESTIQSSLNNSINKKI